MPEQEEAPAEDLYEDTHHIQPHKEEEAYDLPDDMQLDKDEKGGEEEGQDGDPNELGKEGEGMESGEDSGDEEGDGNEDKMNEDGPPDEFPELPDMPEGLLIVGRVLQCNVI